MSLRELILPSACASCREPGRGPLCAVCEAAVPWIDPPFCGRCGLPLAAPAGSCVECRGRWSFRAARAAARYEGPARDALVSFKLAGERRAARALARPMLAAAMSSGVAYDALTFVPATGRAAAARGFNPAEELARPIARALRVPLRRLLVKTRDTADQAGLGRRQRRANLAGAFAPRRAGFGGRAADPGRAAPASVLLVDDVLTTGATADACAAALRAGGVALVDVVTFARAGRGVARTTVGSG